MKYNPRLKKCRKCNHTKFNRSRLTGWYYCKKCNKKYPERPTEKDWK